jgi:hypothetical protein
MAIIDEWSYKWFGIWKEMGSHYSFCPSIYDWIDLKEVEIYGENLPKILNYLRTATVVVTTNAINFPNIITGEKKFGSVSYRTDGVWLWFDDLADYIEKNHVTLPKNFVSHIMRQGYNPPNVSNIKPEDLDWPKT